MRVEKTRCEQKLKAPVNNWLMCSDFQLVYQMFQECEISSRFRHSRGMRPGQYLPHVLHRKCRSYISQIQGLDEKSNRSRKGAVRLHWLSSPLFHRCAKFTAE